MPLPTIRWSPSVWASSRKCFGTATDRRPKQLAVFYQRNCPPCPMSSYTNTSSTTIVFNIQNWNVCTRTLWEHQCTGCACRSVNRVARRGVCSRRLARGEWMDSGGASFPRGKIAPPALARLYASPIGELFFFMFKWNRISVASLT